MSYRTLAAAREIGNMPGGVAMLRVLQAHGLNLIACQLQETPSKLTMQETCSVERMIEEALNYVHRA